VARVESKAIRPTVFIKGLAMGAADVVPGVSGGTVAFITGIYEELIDSLCQVNVAALKLLLAGRIGQCWQAINGTFLATLFAGILVSVFSLAKLISWVLTHHPKIIWAYFFGLILFSVFMLTRQARVFSRYNFIFFLAGAGFAYALTEVTQMAISPSITFVFISGAIAISAMILPGISGSFILVILGMYQYIIEAVKLIDLPILAVFSLGCMTGLLSFTHLLSWLLHRFREATFAVLIGFMLGSLNKVWPWKVLSDSRAEINVMPAEYQALTLSDPQISSVLTALVMGILTVYLIDRVSNDQPTK
jgi:putative membrane protein